MTYWIDEMVVDHDGKNSHKAFNFHEARNYVHKNAINYDLLYLNLCIFFGR